jgi:CHAT domain-containing protein
MKSILRIVLFLALAFFPFLPSFSADWSKDFEKIEKYYFTGDYKKALNENKKLFARIRKAEGAENTSTALAYFQQAKIFEGLSKFEEYKKAMDVAFKMINASEKPATIAYAKGMAYAADAFFQYGNYVKADECISIARKILDSVSPQEKQDNINLVYDFKLKAVQIYYHQGYLIKAENLILELITYRKNRIVKEELVMNPKTGLSKQKKLSSAEVKNRNRELAKIIALYANIIIDQNNKFKADSLLTRNHFLITRQITKKDISFVDNQVAWGRLNESVGNNKEALFRYSLAYKYLRKTKKVKYKRTGKQGINIYEGVVKNLLLTGNMSKYNSRRKAIEGKVKSYYGKNSIYYQKALLLQKSLLKEDADKAIVKLESALNLPGIIPAEHLERAKILKQLSNNYILKDNYTKSEDLLKESVRIKEILMGESAPETNLSRLDLANFYVYYSNKFKTAEGIFDKSLPVIPKEMGAQKKEYITFINGLSKLYELTDRFDPALKLLDKAAEIQKKQYGEKNVQYAVALEKLSEVNISIGNYIEAEKKLNNCLKIFNDAGSSEDFNYSIALETYARLCIIEGRYDEAEKNLKKSRKLTKRNTKESLKMGGTMEELATLYIHTGKYQETEEYLKESIKSKETKLGSNHRNLINPYNQLGLLYLTTGNFTEAEKYTKKAGKISLSLFGDSSIKYAESLELLSRIYAAIGDYQQAEVPAIRVVKIENDHYGPNHIQLAKSLEELAAIKYHNKGDINEVEKLYNRAIGIIKNNLGEDNPEYAEALKNLGIFYLETKRIDQAESLLEKPNSIWVKLFGADNIHSAEILYLRGNISYERGKYQEARNFYTSAKNSFAQNFDHKHPAYVKALSKEGQMYFILGDYKNTRKCIDESTAIYLEFVKKYFPALSERQKGEFWKLIKNEFEFYNSVAIVMKDQEPELISNIYNFTLNIKALLLSSSVKVKERIMSSKDTLLINKFESWNSQKELLTSALSMNEEQRKNSEVDITLLEKDIEALERELSEKSELFAKNYEKTEYTWDKVKAALAPNEYAVEIIRFRKFNTSFSDTIYYGAMIISQETKKNPELVLLKNGQELDSKYLKYYRNCIKFNIEDQYSYEMLWKPVKSFIKDDATVFLSGEGVYNQINLEAIPTPDGSFIINKNDIILLSNTRELLRRNSVKVKSAENTVQLFGNPNYYSKTQRTDSDSSSIAGLTRGGELTHKFKQLPGAEQEVVELNALLESKGWKPQIFLDVNATEEKIKNLKNPKVFHIATHGFFMEDVKESNDEEMEEDKTAQNPLLRSGLLLKDGGLRVANNNVYEFNSEEGILTAYEAMNLNFDNTELVVLSACETGLGEVQLGEGVYGLQRAFLVAGASNIIMSLFKVNDEVTKELMTTFYTKWIETGNKRKSFIEAKKAIKAKYGKPIYWGAFVMIGLE